MIEGFGSFGTLVDDGGMRMRVRGMRRMSGFAGNPLKFYNVNQHSEDAISRPEDFAGNPLKFYNVNQNSEDVVNSPEDFAGFRLGRFGDTPSVQQDIGIGVSAIGSALNAIFGTGSNNPCPAGYAQDPNTHACVPVTQAFPWVPVVGLGLAGVALFLVMKKKG